MPKQNCWEFMKCGQEVNGAKIAKLGVCPAATASEADGFCGGKNGGRACAYIVGTFCGGVIQGTHRDKEKQCAECDFYKLLRAEERGSCTSFKFIAHVKEKQKEKKTDT